MLAAHRRRLGRSNEPSQLAGLAVAIREAQPDRAHPKT
jgi:hypothetical protein